MPFGPNKFFCVDFGEESTFVARLSSQDSGTLEEVREFAATDSSALQEFLIGAAKRRGGYAYAYCGISPAKRAIGIHKMDTKRASEPGYLSELLTQGAKIDAASYRAFALDPSTGDAFDWTKGAKDALVCGMPLSEAQEAQTKMVGLGIFPMRTEFSTLASLGGIAAYRRMKEASASVMVVEIGAQNTNMFFVAGDGVALARQLPWGISTMLPAIQKAYALKDEEAARRLLFSATVDFSGASAGYTKGLIKEIQAVLGFHEVQTGESIHEVMFLGLPKELDWVGAQVGAATGMQRMVVDYHSWLKASGITFEPAAIPASVDNRWMGLFSLVVPFSNASQPQTKKS